MRTKAGALLEVPLTARPKPLAGDGSDFARTRTVATARFAYYVSRGALERLPLAGGPAEVLVEHVEEITPAAVTWDDREAVAFVAERTSKDGERHARLWVDGETIDLSEEGAGGTAVALLAAKSTLYAGWLDQRTALVPVHLATVEHGPLRVIRRQIAWNAPPSDQLMELTLTLPAGVLVAVLATPKNGLDFGLARVPLGAETREDAEWTLYPNGLDPSPALGFTACGVAGVAFVQPTDKAPSARRSIRVAEIGEDGALSNDLEVATAKQVDHLDVSPSAAGGAWVAWAGDGRTFVRRLRCR